MERGDKMADKNLIYDYDSKNKEFDEKSGEIKEPFEECINGIIVKPIIEISADIEGLETSIPALEEDYDSENKELDKDSNDIENPEENEAEYEEDAFIEYVNHIVIEPVVKVNINIKKLNTTL